MLDTTYYFGGKLRRVWNSFVLTSALLVYSFGWRTLVVAHEFPPASVRLMAFALDACLLTVLIGMRGRVFAIADTYPDKGHGKVLFWLGLAAGIGLFALRLTSEQAWWTGHLSFAPLPRAH